MKWIPRGSEEWKDAFAAYGFVISAIGVLVLWALVAAGVLR